MLLQRFLFRLGAGSANQVITGLTIGLTLGVAQWAALLQRSYHIGYGWVMVTTIGWTIGWGAGWSLGWQIFGPLGFGVVFGAIGAIAGLTAGVGQWFILRNVVHRAGWWAVVNSIGWAIALTLSIRMGGALGGFVTGIIAAAVTGGPLIWLFRHPIESD